MGDILTRWLNLNLLREPLNWAIVAIFATITLLLMHVVMQGWGAMASGAGAAIGAGPGQTNIAASPDVTTNFSQMANYGNGSDLSAFVGGGGSLFTQGDESKYAEDGWYGNP